MSAAVHLQERDLQFLLAVGELGMLDTDMIHHRHFTNVTLRRCQQRLAQLEGQGLTRSVGLTVWYGNGSGRLPRIHCLTEKGASVVASITGDEPKRVLRSDPRPETLHHRLAVVRTRVAFGDACRAVGLAAPEWILEQDRREDVDAQAPPSRLRVLYHEFPLGGKTVTCQPDAACLLEIPRLEPDTGTTPLLLFWEIDRSTESRKQALSKCAGYAALLESRSYRRYWPAAEQAPVRIFWVCRSQARIDSLLASFRAQPVAQQFRFTTADELRAESALTRPIWQALDGPSRAILQFPAPAPSPKSCHPLPCLH
jgi:hypothetical protein